MLQFSKMLVVDLECTCFRDEDSDKPLGWNPEDNQETIEIGAALVDLMTLEITAVKSFLVRPDGPMGNFCRNLTTLTSDHVVSKANLAGVIGELEDWCRINKFDIKVMPWGSWGDFDRIQFQRECTRKGLKYPFSRAHYSLKGFYSILTGQAKGLGMDKALAQAKVELEGTHHRGVDDARNTAKLTIHVLKRARGLA